MGGRKYERASDKITGAFELDKLISCIIEMVFFEKLMVFKIDFT